jgi:hypothetical protein
MSQPAAAAAAAVPQTTSAPQGQAAAPSSGGGAPTGPAAAEVSVHATGAGGDWGSPASGDDMAAVAAETVEGFARAGAEVEEGAKEAVAKAREVAAARGMSEYEQERAANIARNEAQLRQLGLDRPIDEQLGRGRGRGRGRAKPNEPMRHSERGGVHKRAAPSPTQAVQDAIPKRRRTQRTDEQRAAKVAAAKAGAAESTAKLRANRERDAEDRTEREAEELEKELDKARRAEKRAKKREDVKNGVVTAGEALVNSPETPGFHPDTHEFGMLEPKDFPVIFSRTKVPAQTRGKLLTEEELLNKKTAYEAKIQPIRAAFETERIGLVQKGGLNHQTRLAVKVDGKKKFAVCCYKCQGIFVCNQWKDHCKSAPHQGNIQLMREGWKDGKRELFDLNLNTNSNSTVPLWVKVDHYGGPTGLTSALRLCDGSSEAPFCVLQTTNGIAPFRVLQTTNEFPMIVNLEGASVLDKSDLTRNAPAQPKREGSLTMFAKDNRFYNRFWCKDVRDSVVKTYHGMRQSIGMAKLGSDTQWTFLTQVLGTSVQLIYSFMPGFVFDLSRIALHNEISWYPANSLVHQQVSCLPRVGDHTQAKAQIVAVAKYLPMTVVTIGVVANTPEDHIRAALKANTGAAMALPAQPMLDQMKELGLDVTDAAKRLIGRACQKLNGWRGDNYPGTMAERVLKVLDKMGNNQPDNLLPVADIDESHMDIFA